MELLCAVRRCVEAGDRIGSILIGSLHAIQSNSSFFCLIGVVCSSSQRTRYVADLFYCRAEFLESIAQTLQRGGSDVGVLHHLLHIVESRIAAVATTAG